MANVHIEPVSNSSTYTTSLLEFHADAAATPYGDASDPRIRFTCHGHFDPAGVGDIRFHAVIEVDQHAQVSLIEGYLVEGEGEVLSRTPQGFLVSTVIGDS